MQTFNCSSCAAEIAFQSSVSVSCVCPYCRSLVVRHDKNVEAMGKMAELPDDISPFQIGTTGNFKGIFFTLIGRMKIGWHDGSWNEWFMYTDEGIKGWLAEAQGSLAVSFEAEVPPGEPVATQGPVGTQEHKRITTLDTMPPLGNSISIGNAPYVISDIKKAECMGSEGELPFPAPKGRKTTAIDLLGRSGKFAGIEYDESEKARLYLGEYVEFDDLRFSNLRELPGWNMRSPLAQKKTNGG